VHNRRNVNLVSKEALRLLLALIVPLALASCDSNRPQNRIDFQNRSEVANEAIIIIPKSQLNDLVKRAQSGELKAARKLANYYIINLGDYNHDSIRWQLQAARLGDCEHWADLMFLEKEEHIAIPSNLFLKDETLLSIGGKSGCPKYQLQKTKWKFNRVQNVDGSSRN
jgi:hypothetical protein